MSQSVASNSSVLNVAINGFGRIGRNVLRAWIEESLWPQVHIVAINDIADPELLAHLLRFDSTHGRFNAKVEVIQQASRTYSAPRVALHLPGLRQIQEAPGKSRVRTCSDRYRGCLG
ncbi:MAG: hypothetical protein EOO68_12825 [Moraxellaceae bacterium]|nr:MAG: hypothetical protein EOO68_12825 [Moraxellaceae bacterium]